MKFSEVVRLLEENGFRVVKEKGSIRYYGKLGWNNLIRVDYHRSKEVLTACYTKGSRYKEIRELEGYK